MSKGKEAIRLGRGFQRRRRRFVGYFLSHSPLPSLLRKNAHGAEQKLAALEEEPLMG
jgi:hypothetical protein